MKVSELLSVIGGVVKNSTEAEQIIEWALFQSTGKSFKRSEWMSDTELELNENWSNRAVGLATERATKGIPLQYLTNEQWFYGRRFQVEKGVLIPRPETEILVEEVLKKLIPLKNKPITGFEFGVGAGPIAISLLAEIPNLKMSGSEINEIAALLTKRNAKELLGSLDRLTLSTESLGDPDARVDFIVSNPPYLVKDKNEAEPQVVLFEPENALFSTPEDDIYFYKVLKTLSNKHLISGGFLALEIPHERVAEISRLFHDESWRDLKIISDLNSRPRVLVVTLV